MKRGPAVVAHSEEEGWEGRRPVEGCVPRSAGEAGNIRQAPGEQGRGVRSF